jgi:hypothetical protein
MFEQYELPLTKADMTIAISECSTCQQQRTSPVLHSLGCRVVREMKQLSHDRLNTLDHTKGITQVFTGIYTYVR